jgi:hypothetical protein
MSKVGKGAIASKTVSHDRTITGLATVALLKANFDEGSDHIAMFLPFVLDAVAALHRDDFEVIDVRDLVFARHHLSIPDATLRTLLHRAAKRGIVRRAHGRYSRNREALKDADITPARQRAEREQVQLAAALRVFAAAKSRPIASNEEALALLLAFLADNEIAMLLDEQAPVDAARHVTLSARDTRLVARFINDVCLPNAQLGPYLRGTIEGLVLQNALLLKDIATAPRKFIDLWAYLDTGLLIRVLGFEGPAATIAAREGLELLRATNATLAVFEKTVDELKRILATYEHKLATAEGRKCLRPTNVTRHFLNERYSPSDVRQAGALVERHLRQLGIEIRPLPTREARFTRDEKSLTEGLNPLQVDAVEPRVQHDVDCVAAILTLRGSKTPDSLDDAHAVFVTTSGAVVQTVRDWWAANGETSLPPMIHYIALSNAAWLKRPGAATDLKLQELIALCAAALRPSRAAWDRFLGHLRKLEESGDLSTDEAIAVTASSLTDKLLSEVEDEDGLDAATLDEVVERVKATYRAEADQRVAAAEAHAALQAEERRQAEFKVTAIADARARWLARLTFFPAIGLVAFGSFASLGAFPAPGSVLREGRWLTTLVVALLGAYALYHDPLKGWRHSFEAWLRRKFRARLLGKGEPAP